MGWIINGTPQLEAESRYPEIIGSAMATTALMLIVVALRAYVRLRMVKNVGADDWCILIAVIFSLPYTFGGALAQTRYGLGLPFPKYPKADQKYSKVLNYTFRAFYCVSVSAFKVALCFSYLRITSGASAKMYRKLIWGTMAFTIIFLIYYLVIVIFPCNPIHRFWDNAPGTCLPNPVVYYSPAVVTIFIDLLLFFLPVPLVLRLQMSGRRKAGLIFAFLLGLLTTVCSVMRLVGSVNVQTKNDPSDLIIWAIAEMNIGIITTSVPTLAPLLKKTKTLISRESRSPYNSKPKSGLSIRLGGLVKPGQKRNTLDTYDTAGVLGRSTFPDSDGSEEDILGDNKSTGTTAHKVERSDSDVEKGRGSIDYPPRLTLPSIVKTTDVDISSQPRTEEVDYVQRDQQRRLRGL